MATVEQVLEAMEHVRACTGDTMAGLSPADLVAISTAIPGGATPGHLDAILAKIHTRYPSLFNATTGAPVPPKTPGPDTPPRQQGDTTDAARQHEDGLARQATAAARLDLLVINAIRNAHHKARSGKDVLTTLQQEIDDAVRRRTDLDTPTGARDFQRFLTGKLAEIEAVLQNADLDDTSYRALMTAWKSLYAEEGAEKGPDQPTPAPAATEPAAGTKASAPPPDPPVDPVDFDDPAFLPADAPTPQPVSPPSAPPPPAQLPFGGAPLPSFGLGGTPSPSALPGGLPLADLLAGAGRDPMLRRHQDDDRLLTDPEPENGDDLTDPADTDTTDTNQAEDTDRAEPPPGGPTTVTLPDGTTVTAASPQLAAAIKAAVEGTPIAEAFGQQGITIPPPGTAVPAPIDPARVAPADIGMFTDRHALAVGDGKALLNGQIQQISTVAGPSFLGWEHPPEPGVTTVPAAPPRADAPAPTRPATANG